MDNSSRADFKGALKINTTLKPATENRANQIKSIESPFPMTSRTPRKPEVKAHQSNFRKSFSKPALVPSLQSTANSGNDYY